MACFPSKHPTLALILNNDQQHRCLQNQGHAALHRQDNINPTTVSALEFMANWVDGGLQQQDGNGAASTELRFNQNFCLKWFVGNVRGMDQYWLQQWASFKATILYHSYINGAMPNLFHTVSHAEFHDPFLRHLMAKYVSPIVNDSDIGMAILTDDSKYHHAIYDYKHVVMHFLAAKLETWIMTFLSPVLGLQHILGSTEFGTPMVPFTSIYWAIPTHLLMKRLMKPLPSGPSLSIMPTTNMNPIAPLMI